MSVKERMPQYHQLIEPTFIALKQLGGSGSNDEIVSKIIGIMKLPDEVTNISHKGAGQSEVEYRAAWARTYLRIYGAIRSEKRSMWAITPNFMNVECVDAKTVVEVVRRNQGSGQGEQKEGEKAEGTQAEIVESTDDELGQWRVRLLNKLHTMNPYAFERLAQRLLRECGFDPVTVTKKSGDGGIDGFGRWKINGIFSFKVAFQCKRYRGMVGSAEIRDFRGSLTTDIEKAVLITTGSFSQAAKDEAATPGKQRIDLMDGQDLIDKMAELRLGVEEVKTYQIKEEFFREFE